MNKERKARFQNIILSLDEAKDELTDIRFGEMDVLDTLPEGLQMSSRGEKMQGWIDFTDDVLSDIDCIVDKIES